MTPSQATMLLAQYHATFVTSKDGVEWWRLPNKEWVGKRALPNGMVQLNKFPANACGC